MHNGGLMSMLCNEGKVLNAIECLNDRLDKHIVLNIIGGTCFMYERMSERLRAEAAKVAETFQLHSDWITDDVPDLHSYEWLLGKIRFEKKSDLSKVTIMVVDMEGFVNSRIAMLDSLMFEHGGELDETGKEIINELTTFMAGRKMSIDSLKGLMTCPVENCVIWDVLKKAGEKHCL